MQSNEKLLLIDGNSILNRAYYGLQGRNMLTNSQGVYTNAIYGFLNIMNKFIEEEKPSHICVAFDLKGPTFRHEKYKDYKGNRKGMPEELAMQVPLIKDVLDALKIQRVECSGYEADDLIGGISKLAEDKKVQTVILTGDRDALQLVSEATQVLIPSTSKGKTTTTKYSIQKVIEKYGVTPEKLIDVKGLMGDSSDNIPGVPGVGEKTALKLIINYDTIEGVYKNLENISGKKLNENLTENKELAFISRELGTIIRRKTCIEKFEDMLREEPDKQKLYQIFKELEFSKFLVQYNLDQEETNEVELDIKVIKNNDEFNDLKKTIKTNKVLSIYTKKIKYESNEMLTAGFYCEGDTVYFIKDFSIEHITSMLSIFENEEIAVYGHHIKTFISILLKEKIDIKNLKNDTMIAEYVIDPSKSNSKISDLALKYLKLSINVEDGLNDDLEKIKNYIGLAAYSVYEISNIQIEKIKNENQNNLFYDIELPLIKVLAEMENNGFYIDKDSLSDYSKELTIRLEQLENAIHFLAGEKFNINSPKQLGVILFEKFNLPVIKKTKTGYSTNAEVLERLMGKHDIIPMIVEYRQYAKLKSTYADGLMNAINKDTGRIHSSFNQTITITGRISSTEPNMQNIPVRMEMGRKIRKVFISDDKDYSLVSADYSQIELRVLAHITQDPVMIGSFKKELDVHTITASQVFEVPEDEVDREMRRRAKAVNFGIIYGISDYGLSRDLHITRKEAKKYIESYLIKYPNIQKYMDDIKITAKNDGFVTTMFNRKRYIPELKSSNFNVRSFGERAALNTPIQGSAADIIKLAMVKVYKKLKDEKLKSKLILQVHDELLIETHKDEKDRVIGLLRECMENACVLDVPLTVDVNFGQNWYDTK